MRDTARPKPAARRRFLRHCVLLGGSATLGTSLAGSPTVPADNPVAGSESSLSGYRLTDHIRRYYATADT